MSNILNDLIEIPYFFLKEYLNGWMILFMIVLIFYFICLRKYYTNKETFYDHAIQMQKTQTEQTDENIDDEESKDNVNSIDTNSNKKIDRKQKPKKRKQQQSKKLKFDKTFIENFENNNAVSSTTPNTTPNTTSNNVSGNTLITTTLFDNLNLNESQINLCKTNYNQVITNYIVELTKLIQRSKSNQSLNVDIEYNNIITKGIDNIINYLSNTIKTYNILTRTTIRIDVNNILYNTVENLISKTNNDLSDKMNKLAMLNSTTIDYNTMLSTITDDRKKLENYIEIDRIILQYGKKNSITDNSINKTLDKSFILPIYERNFDKINQLVKSDFNNNEYNLSQKYGNAYTEFLNEQKKAELNINPLSLVSKIESGVVNVLSKVYGNKYDTKNNVKYTYPYKNNEIQDEEIEQYINNNSNFNSNPIPNSTSKLVNNTPLNENNMYRDRGNLGNYLIDKTTQKQILEGFDSGSNDSNSNSNNSKNSNNKSKNNKNDNNIVSKLFSGNFLEYIMEFTKDKMNIVLKAYNNKIGSDKDNSEFNIDDNLMPLGFMMLILSMLFYFIDITS